MIFPDIHGVFWPITTRDHQGVHVYKLIINGDREGVIQPMIIRNLHGSNDR